MFDSLRLRIVCGAVILLAAFAATPIRAASRQFT